MAILDKKSFVSAVINSGQLQNDSTDVFVNFENLVASARHCVSESEAFAVTYDMERDEEHWLWDMLYESYMENCEG